MPATPRERSDKLNEREGGEHEPPEGDWREPGGDVKEPPAPQGVAPKEEKFPRKGEV